MWIAAGLSDEVYWRLTYEEVGAVLKQRQEEAKRADLRAGVIAATVANVHRSKGQRAFQPQDFLMVSRERQYMTPQEGARTMQRWAKSVNKNFKTLPASPREESGSV